MNTDIHNIQTLLKPFVSPSKGTLGIPQKTIDDLEWDALRDQLAGFAKSDRGYELLQNIGPLKNREDAELRLLHVKEWMDASEDDSEPPVYGVRNTQKAVAHAAKMGVLEAEDLEAIRNQCEIVSRAARYFKNRTSRFGALKTLTETLDPLNDLQSAIASAIEPGGRISDLASPDIAKLRRAVQNQMDRIQSRVDQMIKGDDYDQFLQDEYFTVREDRYVIPVRVGAKNIVGGVVHGYSASGQTAFVEPQELVELNNEHKWAQIRLAAEERKILDRLTRFVADNAKVLQDNNDTLTYLDIVGTLARFATAIGGTVPTIDDDVLRLKSARHPLLFLKLAPASKEEANPTVANDFLLDATRKVLVVSGPNTGGKTVLLKTVGLCALMVRCGMPIPVSDDSKIPFFARVFSDIGDGQSIEHDLSTFSSHLTNIQSFVGKCDHRTLVLLDELFSGTDPSQGSALATALLNDFAARGTTTLVTTHLDGLKTLALEDDRFANASMGFLLDEMAPTFEMTLGVPGSSFALRIASRLGFDQGILAQAERHLDESGKLDLEQVIVKLEKEVEELKKDRRSIHQERDAARREKEKYRDKYKSLLEKERSEINEEAKRLRRELESAFDTLKRRAKEIKRLDAEGVEAARAALRETKSTADDIVSSTKRKNDAPNGLEPIDFADLDIGKTFYSASFRRNGEVLGYNIEGNVTLQLGSLKTTVTSSDLYRVPVAKKSTQSAPQSFSSNSSSDETPVVVQTKQNTCDLRGLRVDDALEKLELFLDAAYMREVSGIHIIHGHGTGALKRAVRGYLPDAQTVKTFRKGDRGEGGDGVTVAWLSL